MIERAGERVESGFQNGPGHLDLGDCLGPFFVLKENLRIQVSDEGVAQPGVPKTGDVAGGLVLGVDLVLGDQDYRVQFEGHIERRIGLIGLTQNGLAASRMCPSRVSSRARFREKAVILGSSLMPFW